jgi:hypothetical protein
MKKSDTRQPRRLRCLLATMTLILAGPAAAQGVFFDGLVFVPLCTGPVVGPLLANLDGDADAEILVPNVVVTLQADLDSDGLAEVDQKVSVKALDQDGSELWFRQNLTTLSNDVAIAQPFLETVLVGTNFTAPPRWAGLFGLGIECISVGVAEVAGERYVTVAVGISAAEGEPRNGEDFTKINLWVLDAGTGAVIVKHQIRPRGSRFWSPLSSGVFDPDGDGDEEFVSVYAKGNSEETIEWKAFIFDLLNAGKERDVIFFQRSTFQSVN